MKRIVAILATAILAAGCYKGVPECKPGTVDYPRCADLTQPPEARMGASLLYPGAAPIDRVSAIRTNASGRLRLAASNLTDVYRSWGELSVYVAGSAGFFRTNSGSATSGPSDLDGAGGVFQMATGATAGSSSANYGPSFLPPVSTGKGYLAVRLKFKTTMDAAGRSGWYLANATAAATVGIAMIGSISTTQVVLQYDGNVGGTGATLLVNDLGWHNYAIWWVGDGRLHASVDGAEVANVLPGSPLLTVLHDYMDTYNGASAVNRQFVCDEWYEATEKQ